MLFRWDAPLFFVNVEIFCEHLHAAIARSASPDTRIVVTAEPVTDIDVSAADRLVALYEELRERGVALNVAEMKGPVKDRLRAYGLFDVFGAAGFFPTVTDAVAHHVPQPHLHARPAKEGVLRAAEFRTRRGRRPARCVGRRIPRRIDAVVDATCPACGTRRFRP